MDNEKLWMLGGAHPMPLLDGPFDKGWLSLLTSAASHALEPYLLVRLRHIGDCNSAQVIESSRGLDDRTFAELQSMLAGGGLPPRSGRLHDPIGIHTVWIIDRTFNAFAVRLPAAYVIGIHIATPIILYRIFRELSKLADFFPEIDGDIARRYSEPLEFESFHPYELDSGWSVQWAMAWALDLREGHPYSKKRLLLAEFLTYFGMQVMMAHEVGHVVCGHCDVLAAAGAAGWKENADNLTALSALAEFDTAKLWEIEADIACANILLGYLTLDTYRHRLGTYLSGLGLACDLQTVTGLVYLTSRILHMILANLQARPSAAATHPHFSGRAAILEHTMDDILEAAGVAGSDFRKRYVYCYRSSVKVALNAVPYASVVGSEGIEAAVNEALAEAQSLLNALVARRGRWRKFSLVQQGLGES